MFIGLIKIFLDVIFTRNYSFFGIFPKFIFGSYFKISSAELADPSCHLVTSDFISAVPLILLRVKFCMLVPNCIPY
jgi:hypothetical protein